MFFCNWKLNVLFFVFLIWAEQFWIWFSWKLTKINKISIIFQSFLYFTPCMSFESWFRSVNREYSSTTLSLHKNRQLRFCQEGARTYGKVKIPKTFTCVFFLFFFFQNSVRNMIHYYNCKAFIILVLFTVPFHHFLFSRYLDHFSSDILVLFPDWNNLYSCLYNNL